MSDSNRDLLSKQKKYYRAKLREAYKAGELTVEEIKRYKNLGIEIGNVLIPGVNDLATTHPEIAAQWHPIKNGNLTPCDVMAGSSKIVWWMCDKGHEWKTNVGNRSRGKGCPYCANRKVLPGFNDLATTNPDLAAEWHPTKNGALEPTDVTAGSSKKVWWLGPCGHEWEAKVCFRSLGSGCLICLNKKVLPGFNDLATTNPDLAAQWHPIKNGDLKPTDVTAGSSKKVWWLGPCGHEWEALVASRSKGIGCPYCSGLKALAGFNDLATKKPDLAAEWHPTKNGNLEPTDVTVGSGKKVWWLGPCGHEWEASVAHRAKGIGCPYCSNRIVLKGFNDLATTNPDLAAEWHPTKNGALEPTDVMSGSNKKVWWLGPCGHEWEAVVNNRAHGKGCPICCKATLIDERGIVVTCIELERDFESLAAAARAVGARQKGGGNIVKALKDPNKTAYGYHWRYADDSKD